MTEARKTIFREKLRSFADIHKSVEEDWIIAIFQKLCASVVQIDWTSSKIDETKLSLAQNLVCVDKYYKRWKEAWNNLATWNPRSPKALPTNTNTNNNNNTSPNNNTTSTNNLKSGASPPNDFENKDKDIATKHTNSSPTDPSSSSSSSPPSGTWTSPEMTRSKLELKKRNADIIHYTIESKYKAIRELVERIAKSINEKSEINNCCQVFPELLGIRDSDSSELLSSGFGTSNNTNNIPSLSIPGTSSPPSPSSQSSNTISNTTHNTSSSLPFSSSVPNGTQSPLSLVSSSVPISSANPLKSSDETKTWRASAPKADPKIIRKTSSNRTTEPPKDIRFPPAVMLRGSKSAEIIKEGFMKKQGTKKSKAWKRRYFILTSEAILGYFEYSSYSKSKGGMVTLTTPHAARDAGLAGLAGDGSSSKKDKEKEKEGGGCKMVGKMKGSLDIWTATQIAPTGAFGIETPGRILKLWCDSEKDMEDWLEVLLKIRSQSRW